MVRTRPTGNGSEIAEVYDNETCRGCHAMLVTPHVQLGFKVCYCIDGERGHRTLTCRDCGTVHIEGTHTEASESR